MSPRDQPLRFGRLDATAPARGERFIDVAVLGGARVEHIVSSDSPNPAPQAQDSDEWVLVVAGGAELEVAGIVHRLAPGDWVLLPAGTAHRVLGTEPGTQWIAVHGPAAEARPAASSGRPGEAGRTA